MSKSYSLPKETIQTIVIDNDDFKIKDADIEKIYNVLKENGSLFVITSNEYKNNVMIPTTLLTAQMFSSFGFFLRNSLIWFLPEDKFSHNNLFINRYKMIFHFTKNANQYFFNKDPIRERHIWEKVEWGKRKKNYNPKGKDPGDVWLKTDDDGKANITKHIPLSKKQVLERIILLSSKKKDKVILRLKDKKSIKICEENGRKLVD